MPAKNKNGEKFIASLLKKNKIDFETRKKMKMKKDTKKYRVPDFYLPEYNIIIEFFGSWVMPENKKIEERERKRFMEKVGVYHHNKIHTLYLYPNQLKDAEKLILKAIKDIKKVSNLPTKFVGPLYWNIPWMKPNVIEKPRANDFIEKKKTVTVEKVKVFEQKEKVFVGGGVSPREVTPKVFKEEKTFGTLAKILMLLAGINVLLLIGFLVTTFTSGFLELNGQLFQFIVITTIAIGLHSAVYAIHKNIFTGFVIVGAIILILAMISLLFFGDAFQKAITIVIIVVAVLPIEYYMVTYNESN